jgi:predicted O-methyltransferase YrrM
VAAVRATLVSAGLPPWELDDPGEEPRRQLLRTLARRRQDVRVLREDPLAPGVEAQVRTILAGRRLDFVFIIGEDDEERVRACLDAYAPLAAPGSLVALDGIRPRLGEGVRLTALWQQVQDQARTQEIVADRSRPGAGIGLIHVDERPLTGRPRGS